MSRHRIVNGLLLTLAALSLVVAMLAIEPRTVSAACDNLCRERKFFKYFNGGACRYFKEFTCDFCTIAGLCEIETYPDPNPNAPCVNTDRNARYIVPLQCSNVCPYLQNIISEASGPVSIPLDESGWTEAAYKVKECPPS